MKALQRTGNLLLPLLIGVVGGVLVSGSSLDPFATVGVADGFDIPLSLLASTFISYGLSILCQVLRFKGGRLLLCLLFSGWLLYLVVAFIATGADYLLGATVAKDVVASLILATLVIATDFAYMRTLSSHDNSA